MIRNVNVTTGEILFSSSEAEKAWLRFISKVWDDKLLTIDQKKKLVSQDGLWGVTDLAKLGVYKLDFETFKLIKTLAFPLFFYLYLWVIVLTKPYLLFSVVVFILTTAVTFFVLSMTRTPFQHKDDDTADPNSYFIVKQIFGEDAFFELSVLINSTFSMPFILIRTFLGHGALETNITAIFILLLLVLITAMLLKDTLRTLHHVNNFLEDVHGSGISTFKVESGYVTFVSGTGSKVSYFVKKPAYVKNQEVDSAIRDKARQVKGCL